MPSLTETLDPQDLNTLLSELFPRNKAKDRHPSFPIKTWNNEWDVTEAEVYRVVIKRVCTTTAPG